MSEDYELGHYSRDNQILRVNQMYDGAFEALAVAGAGQQTAVIEASYGANVVSEHVTISSPAAPILTAPKRQIVKFGDVVRFGVTASDPGGPVSVTASNIPDGASWDASSGDFIWKPVESQAGRHEVKFTATNSAGLSVTERIHIEVGPGLPIISAVVNAATGSRDAACSPGSIASLRGNWLASGPPAADVSGKSINLAGTRVNVNGNPAPVLYADLTRVDFLCPQGAVGTPASIVVETAIGSSDVVTTTMKRLSPGIFSLDGSGLGQGLVSFPGTPALAAARDFTDAGQPAQPGDYLSIRATGLGSADELNAGKPLVKIGDMSVQADAVDMIASFAGVFDVKVKLPAGTPTGNDVPVTLELPGRENALSNTVSIAIEPVHP